MGEGYKKPLEQIIDGLKCPKGFRCYKSGIKVLCKARRIEGTTSYLECLEDDPEDCVFSVLVQGWKAYVCRCPLRAYIADKMKS